MKEQNIHDAAWAMAVSVVELFKSALRDDEKHEAALAVYERCRAGIEALVIMSNRETMRLNPSKN
jgi:hypothetical protein